MSAEITTTPVITDLCSVLHIADAKGEWPEQQPIAQLASSYVASIGREMQSDFDLYQMKQQTLNEELDTLLQDLEALQAQLDDSTPVEEVTVVETPVQQAPAMKTDTFTPQQHRELLDRCMKSIRELS